MESESELSSAADDPGHDPDFVLNNFSSETSEEEFEISFNEASEEELMISSTFNKEHTYCKKLPEIHNVHEHMRPDVEKPRAADNDFVQGSVEEVSNAEQAAIVQEVGNVEESVFVEEVGTFEEVSFVEETGNVEAGCKDGNFDVVDRSYFEEAGYVEKGKNADRPYCDSIVDIESGEVGLVQESENPEGKTKSRKRLRVPEKHKGNTAKKLRNSGKSYINKKGNHVPAKIFKNKLCQCRRKCDEKLSLLERKNLFDNFYSMADFKRQNTFLCGLIERCSVKQRRPRTENSVARTGSNKFYLKARDGLTLQVCKKYFLDTFSISDGRMTRALLKVQQGHEAGEDLRGAAGCPSRKIPKEDIVFVRKHIESFPHTESHYTRSSQPGAKTYLSELLDIRKMYTLYVEFCEKEHRIPVKESYYRFVFNTQYNFGFHPPRKDTCKKCDIFNIKISNPDLSDEDKRHIETDHTLHLRRAEKARKSMLDDKEATKDNAASYVCSIDMQKALPFPVLTVSDAYYKRNLYCYNLGVHDLAADTGYFYVWDETIASRGAQEVSSCLVKHLELNARDKKNVIIYSDTCTGQNRNIKLALSLMQFVQRTDSQIERIDQKYLISGHSFLPNDSDFASVELAGKGKTIYVAENWYDIMASCRRNKKFIVCKMQADEFYSTQPLEKYITRRKRNEDNKDVNWLNFQWLRYERSSPFKIFYKEHLQDFVDFSVLDIRPIRKGRLIRNLCCIPKVKLYHEPRAITKMKRKDMIDLLQFIPPVYHAFFLNLKVLEAERNMPDFE